MAWQYLQTSMAGLGGLPVCVLCSKHLVSRNYAGRAKEVRVAIHNSMHPPLQPLLVLN